MKNRFQSLPFERNLQRYTVAITARKALFILVVQKVNTLRRYRTVVEWYEGYIELHARDDMTDEGEASVHPPRHADGLAGEKDGDGDGGGGGGWDGD